MSGLVTVFASASLPTRMGWVATMVRAAPTAAPTSSSDVFRIFKAIPPQDLESACIIGPNRAVGAAVLVGLAHPALELDLHSDQKYGQKQDRPQNSHPGPAGSAKREMDATTSSSGTGLPGVSLTMMASRFISRRESASSAVSVWLMVPR